MEPRVARSWPRMLDAIRASGLFGISISRREQRQISNHFARPGNAAPVAFEMLAGVPQLSGALANFSCRLHADHDVGDHVVCIGEIVDFAQRAGPPLIYHGGGYREIAGEGAACR